jgi:predicted TPR repeat methyltransferase
MAERKPPNDLPSRIAALTHALADRPSDDKTRLALGRAWLDAGECMRVIDVLSAIGKRSPQARTAGRLIAQAEATAANPRAPAAYVRHLFDQFAPAYDRTMVKDLSYRAPQILRQLADMMVMPGGRFDILDLGCGTGLAGVAFKDLAASLHGVDLSPAMIGAAKQRGIYDALETGDIEAALSRRRSYGLILAADTLVYLGDLEGLIRAARRRLAEGGLFLFTVEKKLGKGYGLGKKRRYRHSESYIRALAEAAKLEVMAMMVCVPRHDSGAPVPGLAVALQRV